MVLWVWDYKGSGDGKCEVFAQADGPLSESLGTAFRQTRLVGISRGGLDGELV